MNVLGVIFDSKLQWAPQVAQAIRTAKWALHAIGLVKPPQPLQLCFDFFQLFEITTF